VNEDINKNDDLNFLDSLQKSAQNTPKIAKYLIRDMRDVHK
jgi:hypothetical protein